MRRSTASEDPRAHRRQDYADQTSPLCWPPPALRRLPRRAIRPPSPRPSRSTSRAPATTCARRSWASSASAPASRRGRSSIPRPRSRIDRLRTAPVDCVLLDAPFARLRQQREAAAADRHLAAAQLVEAASAPEGRPRHADGAAGLRRQSRPHDVSRRGAHQGVVRADVLPDGLDRLQRLQDPGREQHAVVGRAVQSQMARQGRACSASTGWAC